MKVIMVISLLAMGSSALEEKQPDDGIYLRAQGESALAISTQDGRKMFLGAKTELRILESELTSQNNANDRFHLYLTIPYDENLSPSSYILIVASTAYGQNGSGASGKQTSSISFYVSTEEKAQEVSQYAKTPIRYRKHPGHNLRVTFVPTREEFSVGDEVRATLLITNVGVNTVSFMKGGRNRAPRDNQYVFCAYYHGKQVEDTGSSYHFGGLAARQSLKPGETFQDTISVSKWFAFDEAGTYEVHGSYYLDFTDPEEESWRTIWEDYVGADFIISIKKPEKPLNKKARTTD